MLGCHRRSRPIQPSEHDSSAQLAPAHVVQLGRAVYDMVDRLQRKVHCHEFDHWSQAHQSGPTTQACEAGFSDWSVPEAFGTVLVD